MKLLFLALTALLIAVGVGTLAGNDSGHLVMSVSGWTVQTSLTLFLFLLFISFVLLYYCIRTITRIWSLPREIEKWKRHRNQRRAEKYLTQGMLKMVEGNWRQAEHSFRKAAPYSRAPFLNYLYAARAAQQQGELERRDSYLRLAYLSNPDAIMAVGITQAELQLGQKQNEQALATLKHLSLKQPEQGQVKALLLNTYANLNEWNEVLAVSSDLEKGRLHPQEQIVARQLDAYAGLLHEAGNTADLDVLERRWRSIPGKLKKHFYLIEIYISERLRFADTRDCEILLRQSLKRKWDSALVRLYGLVEGNDTTRQIAFMERFLSGHARDPILLLTLGRLCMRQGLWGKARKYLEESMAIEPNPEACQELAALYDRDGNQAAAKDYYRKGLTMITSIARHDTQSKDAKPIAGEISPAGRKTG